jgi:hypothetical protein
MLHALQVKVHAFKWVGVSQTHVISQNTGKAKLRMVTYSYRTSVTSSLLMVISSSEW